MRHTEAQDISATLEEIPPYYLRQMFKAFRLLDRSLTITIGENWIDRSNAGNMIHDLYSVLTGNLTPDERGVLRLAERIKPYAVEVPDVVD